MRVMATSAVWAHCETGTRRCQGRNGSNRKAVVQGARSASGSKSARAWSASPPGAISASAQASRNSIAKGSASDTPAKISRASAWRSRLPSQIPQAS